MQRRALAVLFALGLAFFTLALGGGALRSLRADGRMPAVDGAYGPFIQELIDGDAREDALRQIRVAATLHFESRRPLLGAMVALAHQIGDAESEAWALREMLRIAPNAELEERLEGLEARDR